MTRALKKQSQKINRFSPVGTLGAMLESCRPANSLAVQYFLEDWLLPLGCKVDNAGNAILRIGDSRVMWSSHTDTVHAKAGRQRVVVNGDLFKLGYGSQSSCLGADCTTGVWLMREMILNKKPGVYVFHASEEVGGVGSNWLAGNGGKLFDGIDFCIAFDRKGVDSVITHQGGLRCASDAFVDSIVPMLPETYRADDTGTFTDSANYVDVIGECSNISVGYWNQHTANETQSISHALALREAMLRFDESKLVQSRKAGEIDAEDYGYGWRWGYDSHYQTGKEFHRLGGGHGHDSLLRYIKNHPDMIADFLADMGIGVSDLIDFEDSTYGGRW
jgi:hypothetical protein